MKDKGAECSKCVQQPILPNGIYFAPTPAHKARLRAIIAPEKPLVEYRALSLTIVDAQARFYTGTPKLSASSH